MRNQSQHRKINVVLNQVVQDQSKGMRYERQHEIDCFHRMPEGGGSIRVTRDAKTMQVKDKGIIKKSRLADINVFSPNRALDYRISVNVELPETQLPQGEPDYTREKNRLHYTHQNVCIDLTTVHAADKVSHSLDPLLLEEGSC
jgi:polynucleotide 5'-triphosphatase